MEKLMFQIGDLVKIKAGYSPVGIVVGFFDGSASRGPQRGRGVRVHWTDVGYTRENPEDLVILNENR
jgi:hypothetical protein